VQEMQGEWDAAAMDLEKAVNFARRGRDVPLDDLNGRLARAYWEVENSTRRRSLLNVCLKVPQRSERLARWLARLSWELVIPLRPCL